MPRTSRSETLAAIGEDALIQRLVSGLPQTDRTLTGPGDDCAVLACGPGRGLTLFKTDCLVAGVHFTMETDAARVGWKALCRAVSDIAAMGGMPREALVTLAMPRDLPAAWPERLYVGLKKAARRWGVGIAGGETSSVPAGAPVVISVALLGAVAPAHLVLRSQGRPGDILAVTGQIGGSIAGWHLDFIPRLAEARWLVTHHRPTAMMDLSDGLARDLPRLAAASGCGWEIDRAALPCRAGCTAEQALGDGEDYELLMAVPADRWPALLEAWRRRFRRLPLTAIGRLVSGRGGTPLGSGWEHFEPAPRSRVAAAGRSTT